MPTNAESLQRLFAPRSIAVVGASTSADKAGYQFLRNLGTFPGPVYAVNPAATEILGRPCFKSLTAIGEPIDLVALCIPAAACASALRAAAACGAGAADRRRGFGETGTGRGKRTRPKSCRSAAPRHPLARPNTAGFGKFVARHRRVVLGRAERAAEGDIHVSRRSSGVSIIIATQLQQLGCGVNLSVGPGQQHRRHARPTSSTTLPTTTTPRDRAAFRRDHRWSPCARRFRRPPCRASRSSALTIGPRRYRHVRVARIPATCRFAMR